MSDTIKGLYVPNVEDTEELAVLINCLPRDQKLITYGRVLAHVEMAAQGLIPTPSCRTPATAQAG